MLLYSTKNPAKKYSLREAVMKGLPDDNGLFMPLIIPKLSDSFIKNLSDLSFQEIAFQVSRSLIQDAIPEKVLEELVYQSINFPAPLIKFDEQKYILELFHGPSLAFKDFGARFMAKLMAYFNREEDKELVILVATSGDTGGAVAAGFYDTPGIKVIILYPSGKVSDLQEKQLTTFGKNVTAIELQGSFDDCQHLVKQAFLDKDLNTALRLSSANSINISRLIPQSFYYFEGYKQIISHEFPVVFCVPSGNFGNLTAGLISKKMGLPIAHFVAATNKNDVIPEYLRNGIFRSRPSLQTISNAMDVGNPSNFARILDVYSSTWNIIKGEISGYGISDSETRDTIFEVFESHNYVIDPHGAVGYAALKKYQEENPETIGIVLGTAHPSKFLNTVEPIIGQKVDLPKQLEEISKKEKQATFMKNDFSDLKEYLLRM